ncbi:cupin domain-containing protein [Actinomycetes bacterium KLBMP 9759]
MTFSYGRRCTVVRGDAGYIGKQGLAYAAGISAESAGAAALCLHTVVIPPGGRSRAHLHAGHESAIYIVSGTCEVWWGEGLGHREVLGPGDFLHIPAGVPHLPANPDPTAPALAVIARTDPNEQESVTLLPHLDGQPPQ